MATQVRPRGSLTRLRLFIITPGSPSQSPASRLEPPQNPDDLSQDLKALLAPSDVDGGHAGVFGLEDDLVRFEEDPLDGGLVVEKRHDDVAVLGGGLAADEGVVPGEDVGTDHALTLYLEEESLIAVHPLAGNDRGAFEILLGEQRLAGSNAAEDRKLAVRGGCPVRRREGKGGRGVQELERARLGRLTAQVPLALQGFQVIEDAPRDEAEVGADLAHGGRIAGLQQELADEFQDFALSGGQWRSHSGHLG